MSLSKQESDIILNKANVALARSQRLVASWLPAPSADELRDAKPEDELQREEDEIFTAVPETLGLGAPLPSKAADGSWNRSEIDSNDKLRRQLLGRNYKKVMAGKARQNGEVNGGGGSARGKAETVPVRQGRVGEDEDDEEDEGRTASIGKKGAKVSKKKKTDSTAETTGTESTNGTNETTPEDGDGVQEQKNNASQTGPRPRGRKKTTSFLDEILAERSKKRKKR